MIMDIIDISDDHSEIEDKKDLLCVYPPEIAGRIPVYLKDLDCLEEGELINDQIISKLLD